MLTLSPGAKQDVWGDTLKRAGLVVLTFTPRNIFPVLETLMLELWCLEELVDVNWIIFDGVTEKSSLDDSSFSFLVSRNSVELNSQESSPPQFIGSWSVEINSWKKGSIKIMNK